MSEAAGDAFVGTIDIRTKAQELADELIGSCNAMPEEVFEIEGFAAVFDELAGNCEECGWWVARDELNDDWICLECT